MHGAIAVSEQIGPQTKHRGGHSELMACAWLLSNGYEVFRNVSQHGEIDIIALRGGKVFYLDCKYVAVATYGKTKRPLLPKDRILMGILPIYVWEDGTVEIDFNPSPSLKDRELQGECAGCGVVFIVKHYKQKFCSGNCRNHFNMRQRGEN